MQSPFSEPLTFRPLIMERIWGGRRLLSYGKTFPPDGRYFGESWDLVDREEAQSVVDGGELDGTRLSVLWAEERERVFGASAPDSERFPILVKILDCRQRLSVQVHPPASCAAELGGEPKTEMWYVAEAEEKAALYVGLKGGVGREDFEAAIRDGETEGCIHQIFPRVGESIFVPSGRLHAIGGGLVIYEIQQNSDTTFRVFDWNRRGLDGKPRPLHLQESLRCIDFGDFEPGMDQVGGESRAACAHFRVDHWELGSGAPREAAGPGEFAHFGVVAGAVRCGGRVFSKGEFFLVPAARTAACGMVEACGSRPAQVLRTRFGVAGHAELG